MGTSPQAATRAAPQGRSSVGAREAAKAVVEDARTLVRAEIALAKAEVEQAVRRKALGAGLLVGAAAMAWLGLQGLLVTIVLALALVLPSWAAALIVTGVLLLVATVLGLLGKSRLAAKVSLDTTKQNVEEDVAWTKSHLPSKGR